MAAKISTTTTKSQTLDINDLADIFGLLQRHGYSAISYYELGLYLGLVSRKLDAIKENNKGDVNAGLRECLKAWLQQADNVKSVGLPSYYSLIQALRKLGENAVADGIDREKHPACVIFAQCKSNEFVVAALPSLAIFLYKEKVIDEMLVPTTGEGSVLLKAVKDAVCTDYHNLEKFAEILKESQNTLSVGHSLLDEYKRSFPADCALITVGEQIKMTVPLDLCSEFTAMREKFSVLRIDVAKAMKKKQVKIKKLKEYFSENKKHLRSRIASCRKIKELIRLIADECSLLNYVLLERAVNRFKVEEAKTAIEKYKEEIDEFYKEGQPLRNFLDKRLGSASLLLQYKAITISVHKSVDDSDLADINILMTNAFQKFAPEVALEFVREGNSFTITCSFPVLLSESLIATALDNIDSLIERGVTKLTIGYSTVYDHEKLFQHEQPAAPKKYIMNSEMKQQLYASVYSSQGTMEQLLISRTIQLLNSEEELASVQQLEDENEKMDELLHSLLQERDTELQEVIQLQQVQDTPHLQAKRVFLEHFIELSVAMAVTPNRLSVVKQLYDTGLISEASLLQDDTVSGIESGIVLMNDLKAAINERPDLISSLVAVLEGNEAFKSIAKRIGRDKGRAPPPGTNKPLIRGPPLSPIALMDIPDDRLTVSELIEFHELLIKGQLEESLPLLDADTIRKIENAASADQGMSLLRQAFEEHPTLLHEMREAAGKIKSSSQKMLKSPPPVAPKPRSLSQSEQHQPLSTVEVPQSLSQATECPPSVAAEPPPTSPKPSPSQDPSSLGPTEGLTSPEYITMKEMSVDLLAGNAPVVSRLNNHLFFHGIIPQDVHNAVANPYPTPNERATRLVNSLITIIQTHSNTDSVFSSLITALQNVGLNKMATKLMETLRMKGGRVDPNLEQQPSVSEGPLQPVDDGTAQSHTPQPTITGSQSSTPTTVIELSSKSEVATNIGRLHSHFASLDSNIRDEFKELVENGKVELKAVASSTAAYLRVEVSSLKYGDVDELFHSLQPHYDFFSCGVLKHLTGTYLSNAPTELTQYIDSVDKFSESSQLKHIRSAIKEKSSSPSAASPTTSDQTKPVVIQLSHRWDEMTLTKFKRVLQYYLGPKVADISTIVDIDFGSVVITLLIPASLSQSLIDAITNKTNSMSRLGILEVTVDKNIISLQREDDNNFDISLHESVKAGDSFEVSMLLQLGADPNSKDERGKSAVEIANEGGHTQIKKILLTGGGEETGEVTWTSDRVTLWKPSAGQCQEVISQLTDSHQDIDLWNSSPDIGYLMMSLALDIRTIKGIYIFNTKITKDVILLLSHKLTNNISLETLAIDNDSINDDGVIALTQSLINNKTIKSLFLDGNPDITSTSAQSLAELLLYNHTLSGLWLYSTNIDTDGVLVLMESLRTNNTLTRLSLDKKHKETCSSLPYYETIENRLHFF